jgi:hypothetical protein
MRAELRWLSIRNGFFAPLLANNIFPDWRSGQQRISVEPEADCGAFK